MNTIKFPPVFQEVFFTVFLLTLLSGGTSCYLAAQPALTPQQNRIFENAMTTWQIGVGAIVGLLGGKATDLLHSEEDEKAK